MSEKALSLAVDSYISDMVGEDGAIVTPCTEDVERAFKSGAKWLLTRAEIELADRIGNWGNEDLSFQASESLVNYLEGLLDE